MGIQLINWNNLHTFSVNLRILYLKKVYFIKQININNYQLYLYTSLPHKTSYVGEVKGVL